MPFAWGAYAKELQDFIGNPEHSLLLDAELDYDKEDTNARNHGAAFLLTSGKYRKHFITLWELYEYPKEFDACIRMLAAKAVELSSIHLHHFDTIVTCTHTAREFLSHIQPLIEQDLGHELVVSEFGHYPWTSAAESEAHNFQSSSVLVFTDVMASGSLVRDMITRVTSSGGNVVAILCIVLSDFRLCDQDTKKTEFLFDYEHGIDGRQMHIPLHSLTTYPVRDLSIGEFDPHKTRRIDFVSAYPEVLPNNEHGFDALFDDREMYEQFRKSDALTFGFFQQEKRLFSLGVRTRRLLEVCGHDIWEKLRHYLQPDALIVSTFKKNDLTFSHFIQAKLQETGRNVKAFVLKREQGDSVHLHKSLIGQNGKLNAKHILLVLDSATTSEDLRSLAALLAGKQVASIRVLCLVNRMGPFTVSFVHRIRQLITGVLVDRQAQSVPDTKPAVFDFIPVFNVIDLRVEDLAKMHDRVRSIIRRFERATIVEHFKHLAESIEWLMTPRSQNTHVFESGVRDGLISGIDTTFTSTSSVAAASETIADVIDEILHARTRERLISLVSETWRPDVFLQIAGLAIADIDYLRLSGHLTPLIDALWNRLKALRQDRFEREEDQVDCISGSEEDEETRGAIAYDLDLEAHLLAALGLIAYFDKPRQAPFEILSTVLFADKEAPFWHAHPINLAFHFRDVRNYGLTVFLLNAIAPGFLKAESVRQALVETLCSRTEAILGMFANNAEQQPNILASKISELVDLLLVEFRVHAQREWHQRIRYLQRYVLREKKQHSAIFTDLIEAENCFRSCLHSSTASALARLPKRIQEALTATLTLREIAKVAQRLSNYPSHLVSELLNDRFHNTQNPHSFLLTVARLANWLRSRESGPPRQAELEEYEKLVQEVKNTIFEPRCALRKALLHFVVPLIGMLLEVLYEANATAANTEFADLWSSEILKLQERCHRPELDLLVLMDPPLLKQVLRNMLSNVRHSLAAPDQLPPRERVRIDIKTATRHLASEIDEQEVIILIVEAEGYAVSEVRERQRLAKHTLNSTTLDDQDARVREFGGALALHDRDGGSGSVAELILISRQRFITLHQEELFPK